MRTLVLYDFLCHSGKQEHDNVLYGVPLFLQTKYYYCPLFILIHWRMFSLTVLPSLWKLSIACDINICENESWMIKWSNSHGNHYFDLWKSIACDINICKIDWMGNPAVFEISRCSQDMGIENQWLLTWNQKLTWHLKTINSCLVVSIYIIAIATKIPNIYRGTFHKIRILIW